MLNGGESKGFVVPFKYTGVARYVITTVNDIPGSDSVYKTTKLIKGKYSGLMLLFVLIMLT